jgi:predicted aldo/keto reductase-like oxidoreductase
MRYRPFGRTGLSVSVVGFGCWPMAGDRYGAIEDDEAIKAIHRALDRGVNCVLAQPESSVSGRSTRTIAICRRRPGTSG